MDESPEKPLSKQVFAGALTGLGLKPGDVVLVHSALRKFGPVEGGADGILDTLLEVIGPGGTLALPTHTFKVVNARNPVFHQTLTPANVGILPNVFRQRPGVVRGLHPTHSLAAHGPRAAELVRDHEQDETPCSPRSPYARLREWGGKILILGEGLNCCTFFHGCEEWARMPWAVRKHPTQLYSITAEGTVIPVKMHGHFINTWDEYPRLEPELLKRGILSKTQFGKGEIRLLEAAPAADWLIEGLQRDPFIVLPAELPEHFDRDFGTPGGRLEAKEGA